MTQVLTTRCYNCGRTRRTSGGLCQHCEQEETEITHGDEKKETSNNATPGTTDK
jgi:NMD protein affecting ribosome stability and mRNA decay